MIISQETADKSLALIAAQKARIAKLEQQLAEAGQAQIHYSDALRRVTAERDALREAARQHIQAIEKYQYGQTPAVPLPGVAKTANELAELLESRDEVSSM